MAVRDQIISEQRTALSNLWSIVEAAGFNRSSILEVAEEEGIFMEGFLPSSGPPTVGASELTSVLNAERNHAKSIENNTIVGERARYRSDHTVINKGNKPSFISTSTETCMQDVMQAFALYNHQP